MNIKVLLFILGVFIWRMGDNHLWVWNNGHMNRYYIPKTEMSITPFMYRDNVFNWKIGTMFGNRSFLFENEDNELWR